MTYQIHTDWLWRQPVKPRKKRESAYPFHKMQPGQFFCVEKDSVKSRQTLYNRINQVAMRQGIRFSIRTQLEDDDIWYYRVYHDGYVD